MPFGDRVPVIRRVEELRSSNVLVQKVHPLAVGNVERFLQQSRMIARKILRTHMKDADDHTINDIVENMASKLFFHGHPINRKEAKLDLKLKIVDDLPPELETALWSLYKDFEVEFDNLSPFNPAADLAGSIGPETGAVAPKEYDLVHAMIESRSLSSKHSTRHRFTLMGLQPGQVAIRDDVLSQGWSHSLAPAAESPPQPS